MRGWLLDTNVVSEPARPRPERRVVDWLYGLPVDRTFISVFTLAEVDRGIEALPIGDSRRRRYLRFRDELESQFSGRVLPLDNDTVRSWGLIAGRYQRELGGRPPPIDGLVGATAQRHRLFVATRNVRDFQNLGVTPFNPWTDDPADVPLQA